jgi:hypothetical integral membrane protein (TIGR02206 family)
MEVAPDGSFKILPSNAILCSASSLARALFSGNRPQRPDTGAPIWREYGSIAFMPPRPAFVLFGPAHLAMLALALLAPVALALSARRSPALDRPIRVLLAALLAGGWLCWYAMFAARGWLSLGNGLPLNLCDWAALALIAALLSRNRFAYELGYFWGLGGTLQGMITPDVAYDFPDPQFIFFFINYAGIITALLYLTFTGMRPVLSSLPRVVVATLGYAVVAGAADFLLRTDYGFLAAKPPPPV